MKVNTTLLKRQREYQLKYKTIIVTYHDGSVKEFTPIQWATFEDGVRKIAREIHIDEYKKGETPQLEKPTRKDYRFFFIVLAIILTAIVGIGYLIFKYVI
jgi:preprotein translocase subunit Sss1